MPKVILTFNVDGVDVDVWEFEDGLKCAQWSSKTDIDKIKKELSRHNLCVSDVTKINNACYHADID